MDFGFTKHAVERFEERFKELLPEGVPTRVAMAQSIRGATLERGFLNDTRRIVWMLERFGDFNFNYYVNSADGIVFVADSDNNVITVMCRSDSGMEKMFGPVVQSRFRKKAAARAYA